MTVSVRTTRFIDISDNVHEVDAALRYFAGNDEVTVGLAKDGFYVDIAGHGLLPDKVYYRKSFESLVAASAFITEELIKLSPEQRQNMNRTTPHTARTLWRCPASAWRRFATKTAAQCHWSGSSPSGSSRSPTRLSLLGCGGF